jgi:hypothetical protein
VKRGLDWEEISRSELADHLQSAKVIRSQALGDTNIYQCKHAGSESIAVALPSGNGLIISFTKAVSPAQERRKRRNDEASAPAAD